MRTLGRTAVCIFALLAIGLSTHWQGHAAPIDPDDVAYIEARIAEYETYSVGFVSWLNALAGAGHNTTQNYAVGQMDADDFDADLDALSTAVGCLNLFKAGGTPPASAVDAARRVCPSMPYTDTGQPPEFWHTLTCDLIAKADEMYTDAEDIVWIVSTPPGWAAYVPVLIELEFQSIIPPVMEDPF